MVNKPKKDTLKCSCVKCSVETDHAILCVTTNSGEERDGTSWGYKYQFIQCLGCKSASIREEFWFSEWDQEDIQITYYPPRIKRRRPDWLDHLDDRDAVLYNLLNEVYEAADYGHHRLMSMGIRSVMDHVMTYLVKDIGGFEQKLDALVEQKIISEKQRELYDTVIEGGSAAAHRGYKPPWALLENMLELMEYLINHIYISGPMLEAAKVHIPPRPSQKKK